MEAISLKSSLSRVAFLVTPSKDLCLSYKQRLCQFVRLRADNQNPLNSGLAHALNAAVSSSLRNRVSGFFTICKNRAAKSTIPTLTPYGFKDSVAEKKN